MNDVNTRVGREIFLRNCSWWSPLKLSLCPSLAKMDIELLALQGRSTPRRQWNSTVPLPDPGLGALPRGSARRDSEVEEAAGGCGARRDRTFCTLSCQLCRGGSVGTAGRGDGLVVEAKRAISRLRRGDVEAGRGRGRVVGAWCGTAIGV